jgi:hypothetical protein
MLKVHIIYIAFVVFAKIMFWTVLFYLFLLIVFLVFLKLSRVRVAGRPVSVDHGAGSLV